MSPYSLIQNIEDFEKVKAWKIHVTVPALSWIVNVLSWEYSSIIKALKQCQEVSAFRWTKWAFVSKVFSMLDMSRCSSASEISWQSFWRPDWMASCSMMERNTSTGIFASIGENLGTCCNLCFIWLWIGSPTLLAFGVGGFFGLTSTAPAAAATDGLNKVGTAFCNFLTFPWSSETKAAGSKWAAHTLEFGPGFQRVCSPT